METWVQSIGTAPIATAFTVAGLVIGLMARHIVKQQDAIVTLQRECLREVKDLTVATNAALSSASQAMTAAGAGMNSAREAMQVATAVMQRTER